MGKFTVKTGKDGQYYFSMQADNGETVLKSEGYTTKAACMNGIESVKKNAGDSTNYESLTSANGKFYFNLKAGNGQIIGTSQMYDTEDGKQNGLASVLKNAHNSEINEI
jgi:uncharacterized protein YegP (UPF0339 family)